MKQKSKIIIALALLTLLLFHIYTNIWFIKADNRPCNINELSHVIGAIDFLNLLIDQEDKYSAYLQSFSGYPPAGIVATCAYAILGRDHESSQLSQLFFSLLLIIGLFGIGKKLFGTQTGLLAVFLCLTAPASNEVSRQYLLEWSLMAMTTLSAFFLLLCDGFSRRKYAILAGIFIGLSALCKQTFLVFLAGPILFAFFQWISKIRSDTAQKYNEKSKAKLTAGIIVTSLLSILISWAIYSGPHRTALDNWFAAVSGTQAPWAMSFLIATILILSLSLILMQLRPTPIRNALSSGLLAVFIASLWYFPKGLMNFMTYYNQMQMNVEKSKMSPGSLLHFYNEFLQTYYLGPVLCGLLIVAILCAALIFIFSPVLKRHFFLRDAIPPSANILFVTLWFIIPVIAFFFINIQNEMNTVPLLPPLYLAAAAVLARLELPYSKKTLRRIKGGRKTLSARIPKHFISGMRFLLIFLALINGFAMSWIFKSGSEYKALPFGIKEKIAKKLMPRKFNDLNYLVPRPGSWHEKEITQAMIQATNLEQPRILIMDVDFYFSWNTFWYMFKLVHHNAEIQTQWYDDRPMLLEKDSEVLLFSYDVILYRQPWKKIYVNAYNDYLEYKNLWETYAYLSSPPETFFQKYEAKGQWKLPDDSTAFILVKRSSEKQP